MIEIADNVLLSTNITLLSVVSMALEIVDIVGEDGCLVSIETDDLVSGRLEISIKHPSKILVPGKIKYSSDTMCIWSCYGVLADEVEFMYLDIYRRMYEDTATEVNVMDQEFLERIKALGD